MSTYMQLKYKTKFTDKEILKRALKEANILFKEKRGELICNTISYEFHFRKDKNGEYEIKTKGYNDWVSEIKQFRNKITPIYNNLAKEQIQREICKRIKEKVLQNSSIKLEQEEVLEDNSILLTISI